MTARWTQRNPQLTWLAAVATLLFVDQVSKSFFSTTLEPGEAVQVTEWLNFVHVLNTGAAFSLLADAGGWQRWFFIGVSVLVVGAVTMACLARQARPIDRWVGAFVVGMLLTPPDVFSQTLLAIPMYCLFEVGVFFARFYTGKRLTRDDDAAAEAEAAEHREE